MESVVVQRLYPNGLASHVLSFVDGEGKKAVTSDIEMCLINIFRDRMDRSIRRKGRRTHFLVDRAIVFRIVAFLSDDKGILDRIRVVSRLFNECVCGVYRECYAQVEFYVAKVRDRQVEVSVVERRKFIKRTSLILDLVQCGYLGNIFQIKGLIDQFFDARYVGFGMGNDILPKITRFVQVRGDFDSRSLILLDLTMHFILLGNKYAAKRCSLAFKLEMNRNIRCKILWLNYCKARLFPFVFPKLDAQKRKDSSLPLKRFLEEFLQAFFVRDFHDVVLLESVKHGYRELVLEIVKNTSSSLLYQSRTDIMEKIITISVQNFLLDEAIFYLEKFREDLKDNFDGNSLCYIFERFFSDKIDGGQFKFNYKNVDRIRRCIQLSKEIDPQDTEELFFDRFFGNRFNIDVTFIKNVWILDSHRLPSFFDELINDGMLDKAVFYRKQLEEQRGCVNFSLEFILSQCICIKPVDVIVDMIKQSTEIDKQTAAWVLFNEYYKMSWGMDNAEYVREAFSLPVPWYKRRWVKTSLYVASILMVALPIIFIVFKLILEDRRRYNQMQSRVHIHS